MLIEGPFEAMYSVLVIDDDDLSRQVLSVLLEAEGYRVRTASSGEDALIQLAALSLAGNLPQVVLTDLQMPGLTGNALAESLRSLYGPSLHLIVMSAGGPEASLVTRYDHFLRKPICVRSVTDALAGLERAKNDEATAFAVQRIQTLDEAIYTKLAAAMSAQQVIDTYRFFVADACHRTDRMRAAIHLTDEASLRKEAHTLRGGCGMLGATEMCVLAASMEDLGFTNRTTLELQSLLDELVEACERLRSMLEAQWRRDV